MCVVCVCGGGGGLPEEGRALKAPEGPHTCVQQILELHIAQHSR